MVFAGGDDDAVESGRPPKRHEVDQSADSAIAGQNLGANSESRKRNAAVMSKGLVSLAEHGECLEVAWEDSWRIKKEIEYLRSQLDDDVKELGHCEENEKLRVQLALMMKEMQCLRKQNEDMQANKDSMMKWNEELEAKIDGLVKLNEELQTKNDGLVKQNEELQTNNDEMKKWNKELQAKNNGLTKWKEELQTKHDVMSKQNQELQAKNVSLVKQNDKLQTKNGMMIKWNSELHVKNGGLTNQNEELQANNDGLKKRNKELQAKNDSLMKQAEEIGCLQARVANLVTTINELMDNNRTLLETKEALKEEYDTLKDQAAAHAAELERTRKRNEELSGYLIKKKSVRNIFQNILTPLQSSQAPPPYYVYPQMQAPTQGEAPQGSRPPPPHYVYPPPMPGQSLPHPMYFHPFQPPHPPQGLASHAQAPTPGIDVMKEQNGELQAENVNASLSFRNEELQAKNSGLMKQNEELQAKNGVLSFRNEELLAKNDDLMKQNVELQAENDGLWKVNEKMQAKNGGLSFRNEELLAKNDDLMEQNGELQAKNDGLWKWNEKVQAKNDTLTKRIEEQNDGLMKRAEEIRRLKAQVTKLFTTVNQLMVNNSTLVGTGKVLKEFDTVKEDVAAYAAELKRTRRKNKDLSGDLVEEKRPSNDEGLEDELNGQPAVGIKRMGELDEKLFQNACKRKYGNDDYQTKAAELVSVWQVELTKPSWHPFKAVRVNGEKQEVLDDDDAKLTSLQHLYGDEVCDAVKTALMEMKVYSPSGRYVVPQIWNFKKGQKATMREVLKYQLGQLETWR